MSACSTSALILLYESVIGVYIMYTRNGEVHAWVTAVGTFHLPAAKTRIQDTTT